ANFLAAFIPGQFILIYGKDSAEPFFFTALTYGVILCVAIGMLYLSSWERPTEETTPVDEKKMTLGKTMLTLLRDMKSTFHLRV
ncbi:MFS transporter, partial [Salmonella enterica subsp. enterica]